jgi:MerR family Zn(II)-responsive transcriptional regulator of zntA
MGEAEANGNNGRLMRIGDLARKAGTTMRTIRYYEQLGLIAPVARTRGGFRLYEEDELRKLRLIKTLQLVETPLAQVKAFFEQRRRGKAASDIASGISQLLERQLREVEERIAQFRATEASLRETIEILRCCAGCGLEPGPEVCPRCPVIRSRPGIPPHMQAVIELAERTRLPEPNGLCTGGPAPGGSRRSGTERLTGGGYS